MSWPDVGNLAMSRLLKRTTGHLQCDREARLPKRWPASPVSACAPTWRPRAPLMEFGTDWNKAVELQSKFAADAMRDYLEETTKITQL